MVIIWYDLETVIIITRPAAIPPINMINEEQKALTIHDISIDSVICTCIGMSSLFTFTVA